MQQAKITRELLEKDYRLPSPQGIARAALARVKGVM